jgi:hypothetical protein
MEQKLVELCLDSISDQIICTPPLIRDLIDDAVMEKVRIEMEETIRSRTCKELMKVVSTMAVQLKEGDELCQRRARLDFPGIDIDVLDAASDIVTTVFRIGRKRKRSY